jgi:nucleoside-diphosphate kinase
MKPDTEVKPDMLFIGATVTIFHRQLKIISLNDQFTTKHIESKSEKTLAMIKPDAYQHLGKILNAIYESGFRVNNLRACKLSLQEAQEFYAVHKGKPFYEKLTNFMSSGRILALELVAPGAISKWRQLIGPTDSNKAREEAPNSIRAHFGTDGSFNAVHGSDAPDTAAAEISFFFSNPSLGKCDVGRGTTLGLIKPHAVVDGISGLILDVISERFEVTAVRQLAMDRAAGAEFLEVYKGVLAMGEFSAAVDELISGPCIACELAAKDGGDSVSSFRQLCGPMDSELARVLRPDSLRAKFGLNKTRNAIHCTDLPEDGGLEVEYIFSILV